MGQGIYDKLEETYKLLKGLNNQLCCGPEPSTTTSTSTTSTTTQAPEFFRASSYIALVFAGRQGFIGSRASWYGGNTVASITATNPNLVTMQVRGADITGSNGDNHTFTYRETMFSPSQTVTPTYTTFDGVSGLPIMISVKDFYQYAVKIINNTYLSTRNPSIFIKRVSSANGLGTGIYNDALFVIGIDIDATGNERWGYNLQGRGYDLLSIPGTLNISSFTYSALNNSGSISSPDDPMYLFTPSTTWVNGVTIIPAYNVRVEENVTIPPGW